MTGFELRTSGVGTDRSANRTTTTAHKPIILIAKNPPTSTLHSFDSRILVAKRP